MKSANIFSTISRITLVIMVSLFMGCSGGSDPALSVKDQVMAKLTAKPWNITTVTVDNVDQTGLFTGFKITFSATGFTTQQGGPTWPASGTWTFTDENASGFTRSDGLIVTLQEVTATTLKMSLIWDKNTFGPGRTSSIDGQHIFSLGN